MFHKLITYVDREAIVRLCWGKFVKVNKYILTKRFIVYYRVK